MSSGTGMTNWCWSLGTACHLLIHHSEGHISLSNLCKALWIAWLQSRRLCPTPHALGSSSHSGKHACLPAVTFRRAALTVSLHPPILPSQRSSLWSPELFAKLRTSCPLCQQFPRTGWRSNFHLFYKNEQHLKFCRRAKFIYYKRRSCLVFQPQSLQSLRWVWVRGGASGCNSLCPLGWKC